MFQALVTRQSPAGDCSSAVETLDETALPAGAVTVDIEWSGLNYKDALCLAGRAGLVRQFPHVAGIDFAGRVRDSADPRYQPGQGVILTGWGVGERYWGGFSQLARVDADWLVPLPRGMSTRQAMLLGTAGLTAMLAVNRLKADGLGTDAGELVVTGAGGGVGSLAVLILARLGHAVAAVSRRPELAEGLMQLGAARVIGPESVVTGSGKGLDRELWVAAIDTVGGPMLAELLKKIRRNGAVAALGNAGGVEFPGSVLPFILRGVTLYGIDSVQQPFDARVAAWEHLGALVTPGMYQGWVAEIGLGEVPAAAARMPEGGARGRVLVDPRR